MFKRIALNAFAVFAPLAIALAFAPLALPLASFFSIAFLAFATMGADIMGWE